ncbi:YolD-like family protein [Lysinibacillus xylanilyticus]|uniref:YolD-like family protein n=1 Tax=Lysinibacillus xylanilyticus TaxID=582475 RepID=UPI002B240375|nr:YolD-like family protein [Lysinibacillus xylanilyticus]MEB2301595.1 YolD-like family protein [Lysinibacillus xylanilyticus]
MTRVQITKHRTILGSVPFRIKFIRRNTTNDRTSYNQQRAVKLEVWSDGKTIQWVGKINAINITTNELTLETLLKTKRIPLQNIYSAQLDADYYD